MVPLPPPSLSAPWTADTLLQLRTSRMKPMHNLTITTGIYKLPRSTRVFCTPTGFDSDEHDLTFHGGVDKAVHQYFPSHYASWRAEFPEPEGENFEVGGFGENLVSEKMNERNVCIGDKIRVGEALLQVSLPRQPCFKLNHRFALKGFASQTYKKSRTGWYYRVLETGWVGAGDEMRLVERLHPRWTIERVQEYLHRDTGNLEMLEELAAIDEFGAECKRHFKNLISKAKASLEGPKKNDPEIFHEFELISKATLTPRITTFTLQKVGGEAGEEIDPGCFARLKVPDGLIRTYSIVSGDSHKFTLGIALEDNSRGGSCYLHQQLKEGDKILVGKITESVPIPEGASNHIFIAGGIGITAFLHHMDVYDQINFNYTLHYAVRSEDEMPYRDILEKNGNKVAIYDKSKGQRMDISQILKNRVWNSYTYVCGPPRLIDDFIRSSNKLGISSDEVHLEAFQIATSGDPFTVELKKDGRALEVKGEQTLLQVLKETGLEIDSSCEAGNCGTCKVEVCEGRVEHRGSALSEEEKRGSMLSCVSRGVGRLVIDF